MPVRPDTHVMSGRTSRDTNGSSIVTHSVVGEQVTQDDPIANPASDLLDPDPDRTGHETGPNGSNSGTERVKSETERVTQDDLLDGLTLDGLTPDGEKPSDEEHSLSRNRGTSPSVGSDAPTQFDAIAQRLYDDADADMDRECPNCHADAHEWCQREDGSRKRMPCLVRSRRRPA